MDILINIWISIYTTIWIFILIYYILTLSSVSFLFGCCILVMISFWIILFFFYRDPDPFVHLVKFLSHDTDCNFLFLENHRAARRWFLCLLLSLRACYRASTRQRSSPSSVCRGKSPPAASVPPVVCFQPLRSSTRESGPP